MSEIQDIAFGLNRQKDNTYHIANTLVNISNVNLSEALVSSVSDSRDTCTILLINENERIENVKCRIPTEILNTTGHLLSGDYVLVKHIGRKRDCEILARIQTPNGSISEGKAFKKSSGKINWGVLGV